MRKTLAVVLVGAMILFMTVCSANETKTTDVAAPAETTTVADTAVDTAAASTTAATGDETVHKISVLQLVQHAALGRSNKGSFAALDDAGIRYEADQQNAASEQSNCQIIAEKLVNDKDDSILAIAIPAAQVVAGVTTEILILLTTVTDLTGPGLANSNDEPGVNVSGISDLTPVLKQIDSIKQLISDVKNVGILYCPARSDSASQVDTAKAACDAVGLTYKGYTASNPNEIQTVVESMISKVGVIYAPADNMIVVGMTTVAIIATDNGIPAICGEAGMVETGGLVAHDISYLQLGHLAGQQVTDILVSGADVAKTPVGYLLADRCTLAVGRTTADVLGIDITRLEGADVVE